MLANGICIPTCSRICTDSGLARTPGTGSTGEEVNAMPLWVGIAVGLGEVAVFVVAIWAFLSYRN